jgi:hypothetical protein
MWIVHILAVATGYLIWWPLHHKLADGTLQKELWLSALTLLLSTPIGILISILASWLVIQIDKSESINPQKPQQVNK